MDQTNLVVEPKHPGEIGGLVPDDESRDFKQERVERQEQFKVDKNLTKELLALKKKCEDRQKSEWLDIKKQMIRCRKYNDGEQFGDVSDDYDWIPDKLNDGEAVYIDNIFHTHVQTALTELVRANAQLNFSYTSAESRKGEILSNFLESRYRTHRQMLFSAVIRQQEKLSALLNGVSARYTFFEYSDTDKQVNTPTFSAKPQEEQKESEESLEVCATCYAPKQGDKCPKCQDTDFKVLSAGGKDKVIEMEEESPDGCNKFVNVDPLGLIFDLKAQTIKDSSYLVWKQNILSEVLESKYPDITLEDGGNDDAGLSLISDTSTPSGPNRTDNKDGTKPFDQCWFDYPMYCHKKLTADITLRNGKVLKAGTTLGKAFPKGLFIATNGDRILDIWGEDKNRKWTIAPYVTRTGTLVGAGLTVLLAQQDRVNDIENLIMVSNFNDTYPKEFLNSKYITNDDIPSDPTERAEIEGIPDGVRIVGGVIDAMPGTQLAPQVRETRQSIEQSAQAQVGTFSTGGAGMPDLKAATDTLGGMQLYREQTVGRFAPMLELMADLLDKEQAYQFFENDQEFLSPQEWKRIAGDYGKEAVETFLECDIRRDIVIEVVRESYMPKTSSQKQMNLQGYLTMMGAMANIGQTNPEQLSRVAELFDQPQVMSDFKPVYAKAMQAASVFEEISEAITSMNGDIPSMNTEDPMTRQLVGMIFQESGIELDIDLDNHAVYIEGYMDWWASDKGRDASNLLKACISMRVDLHKIAAVKKAQKDAQLAMAAQQPEMEMQAEQQQQMEAKEQEQAEAEQQGAMVEGLAGFAEKDAERENRLMLKEAELDDKDRQREHERQMAAEQQQAQQAPAEPPGRRMGVVTMQ